MGDGGEQQDCWRLGCRSRGKPSDDDRCGSGHYDGGHCSGRREHHLLPTPHEQEEGPGVKGQQQQQQIPTSKQTNPPLLTTAPRTFMISSTRSMSAPVWPPTLPWSILPTLWEPLST